MLTRVSRNYVLSMLLMEGIEACAHPPLTWYNAAAFFVLGLCLGTASFDLARWQTEGKGPE